MEEEEQDQGSPRCSVDESKALLLDRLSATACNSREAQRQPQRRS